MISLTYISTATRELDLTGIRALLETSRRNNAELDLTGMLLYAGQHFIQTLEGERRHVEGLLETIRDDERHHHLAVALVDEIEQRAFPDWTMGCRVLTAEQAAALPGLNDYLDPDSSLYASNDGLGRAGVFHRIFRDTLTSGTEA